MLHKKNMVENQAVFLLYCFIGILLYLPFYSWNLYKAFSLNCFLVNYLRVGDCKTNLAHGTESNIKETNANVKSIWPLVLAIQTSEECRQNIKKQSWQCFTQKHTVASLAVWYYIISWRISENKILYIWFSSGLYASSENGVLHALTHSQMKGRPYNIIMFKAECSIWMVFFFHHIQAQSISQHGHTLINRRKVVSLTCQNRLFGWACFPAAALTVAL